MAITIVPINKGNLSLVAKAAAKFGMPRSTRWLERCLYDPTVKDLVDSDIRGHMAVRDDGVVVAIQCYYYMPGYFKRQKFLMNTGCIMGADAKYGEELICCLDENKQTTTYGLLSVGNCIASPRSAKFAKAYSRMKEAPEAARYTYLTVVDFSDFALWFLRRLKISASWLHWCVWAMMRPIAWIANIVRFSGFQDNGLTVREFPAIDKRKFGDFWECFLEKNTGVVTSREPERLSWLFDESMRAGFVKVLAAEKGDKIVGNVLLRRYPCKSGPLNEYAIYDICAIDNDIDCLRYLVRAAVRYAARHRGARVIYSGAAPLQEQWINVITWHRRTKSQFCPFFYKARDKDIENSLKSGDGWFWGAFDGEKCLGHGRFIDA